MYVFAILLPIIDAGDLFKERKRREKSQQEPGAFISPGKQQDDSEDLCSALTESPVEVLCKRNKWTGA